MTLRRLYARVFVFADRHARLLWICAAILVAAWSFALYREAPKSLPLPGDAALRYVRPGDIVVIPIPAKTPPGRYRHTEDLEVVEQ